MNFRLTIEMEKKLTYSEIKKNKEVCEYLKKGDENLGILGFTDHSAAHW